MPTPLVAGRRNWLARRNDGGRSRTRWRYPFTRATPLRIETGYHPTTLRAERRLMSLRPVLWVAAFVLLAILPPWLGNNSLVSAAATFAVYASINVIWTLTIGTAGIFSLASLATVGVAAFGTAWLSVDHGFPFWALWLAGPFFGLAFGVVIAIPAIRLEGFYYALLTVGITELCRVWVIQSQTLGAASYGLFGADGFVPEGWPERSGLVFGYLVSLVLLLATLAFFIAVDRRRLGVLLRVAPERHEAFAEALGIDFRAARIRVFLISSAALGVIGGFYTTLLHGASPSLFTMDQLLLLLAMIVIGGIGTAEGAVLGTLIVVVLDKVFIGLGPVRLILIALFMLGTVLFLRGGLFGAAEQFSTWRKRRRSQRRGRHSDTGGDILPEDAIDIADKQSIAVRRFDGRLRHELKALVTDALIEEHRTTHGQRRSDALERVLAFFRRAAVADKYAILAVRPFAEYRIIALSGRRGVPPRAVDDQMFATPEEALHGVFLRRIQDLMDS